MPEVMPDVTRVTETAKALRAEMAKAVVGQIEVIDPSVICLLGGVATKALLGVDRISEVRGKRLRRQGRVFFPTYHPAAAGRSRAWYRALLDDMAKLKEWLQCGSPRP